MKENLPGFTRPGRALAAWLHWIGSGLDRAGVSVMFSQGLLSLPQDSEIRSSSLLSLITELPVGKGRESWQRAMDGKVDALERRSGNRVALTTRGARGKARKTRRNSCRVPVPSPSF